jgi:hypothetical protein
MNNQLSINVVGIEEIQYLNISNNRGNIAEGLRFIRFTVVFVGCVMVTVGRTHTLIIKHYSTTG